MNFIWFWRGLLLPVKLCWAVDVPTMPSRGVGVAISQCWTFFWCERGSWKLSMLMAVSRDIGVLDERTGGCILPFSMLVAIIVLYCGFRFSRCVLNNWIPSRLSSHQNCCFTRSYICIKLSNMGDLLLQTLNDGFKWHNRITEQETCLYHIGLFY